MHEDLEPIASLKYGAAIQNITSEERTALSATIDDLAARGLSNSGMMTKARLDWATRTSERVCRTVYNTWLELILQRNGGTLNREDIGFIMAKVKACADAQERNIAQSLTSAGSGQPPLSGKEWAVQQGQTSMRSVAGNIAIELEIKFREQEAFRKEQIPLEVGFKAFLLAFGEHWLTLMSGPLTVPFTIAAVLAQGSYKTLFVTLAMTSAVFSSYRVWRKERQRVNDLRTNQR